MSFKKYISSLTIIIFILTTGCSQKAILDNQNSKSLNYNFKISDLKNIDNTLSNQLYSYDTSIDKKYVAVITYQSRNASINQYLVNNNGTINCTVHKGSNFIISLPANRTITYTWNIKNDIDNGIIQLKNRYWIDVSAPKSEKSKIGVSYDRQNLYFNSIKTGNEKVVMRYEHKAEQRNEFFEVTFNINIV